MPQSEVKFGAEGILLHSVSPSSPSYWVTLGPADSRRAVWTRFHPIAYAVQEVIHSGKLGKIKRFSADFSADAKPDCTQILRSFELRDL